MKRLNYQKGISPIVAVILLAVVLIGGGAYYFKQQAKPASKPVAVDTTATWKTFTYPGNAFTIQYPPNWTVSQGNLNGGATGLVLSAPEGSVGISENVIFSGTCDQSSPLTNPLQIYHEILYGCYSSNPNGSIGWERYVKIISPTMKYGIDAVAASPGEKNKNTILQILSTLKFTGQNQTMDPTSWAIAGIKDPQDFKNFFANFQKLVKEDQKSEIAKLIRYPLKDIKNEADFIKNYDQMFTQKVKTAVMDQDVEQMFRRDQGVMVGNGEIWFHTVIGKSGYWIIAINN